MINRIITKLVSLPKLATFNASQKLTQRVAAYARVSTDHEEQATSLTAQTDYYRKKIQEHLGWRFVEIYVDHGIPGLSTNRREGFNRMVEDWLAGRIDLVLTKSISRFARNTVDTVTTIRKLKEKGISVYFEKENIFSTDSKREHIDAHGFRCFDQFVFHKPNICFVQVFAGEGDNCIPVEIFLSCLVVMNMLYESV